MSRPSAAIPDVGTLRACIDDQRRLAVRVTPGAKSESIEAAAGRVMVKVRARPQDGKANDAVRALLAKALDVAPSHIELLRGATSREKQFRIGG